MPQIILDRTGYDIQKAVNQTYLPFGYRDPVFYIPSLAANTQQWFAVEATTGSGSNTGRQMLLFVQPKPGGPWKLAAAPTATVGKPLPVALTPAGTATTASPDGSGLAVAPSQLPALHANLIDGSPASPGFAKGRWTSAAARGIGTFKRVYGKDGWNYKDFWTATSFPTYTLRTADGGAVVWYFLKDRQTAIRTGAGQPLQTGSVVRALTGKARVAQRFTIDSLSEFVAIIPPQGKGQITVEAGFSGNVAATGS